MERVWSWLTESHMLYVLLHLFLCLSVLAPLAQLSATFLRASCVSGTIANAEDGLVIVTDQVSASVNLCVQEKEGVVDWWQRVNDLNLGYSGRRWSMCQCNGAISMRRNSCELGKERTDRVRKSPMKIVQGRVLHAEGIACAKAVRLPQHVPRRVQNLGWVKK